MTAATGRAPEKTSNGASDCQTLVTNPLSNTSSVRVSGEITMEIYEVKLCHRGRWEQQEARFVAARDADEAAYKVTGEQLRSEGERRKVRLRVRRLGNGSPPPKLFYAA